MCGVTIINQGENYQVNDLQLKDNKRAALVSVYFTIGALHLGKILMLKYPVTFNIYDKVVKSAPLK